MTPESQYRLALILRGGKAGREVAGRGAEWLRRAAANGHSNAAFELGVAFCIGDGTPRDVAEGARLYAAAATADTRWRCSTGE